MTQQASGHHQPVRRGWAALQTRRDGCCVRLSARVTRHQLVRSMLVRDPGFLSGSSFGSVSVCLADPSGCGSKPSFLVSAWPSLPTWDTSDVCPCGLEIHNQGGERGPRARAGQRQRRAEPRVGGGTDELCSDLVLNTRSPIEKQPAVWKKPSACGPCADSHLQRLTPGTAYGPTPTQPYACICTAAGTQAPQLFKEHLPGVGAPGARPAGGVWKTG